MFPAGNHGKAWTLYDDGHADAGSDYDSEFDDDDAGNDYDSDYDSDDAFPESVTWHCWACEGNTDMCCANYSVITTVPCANCNTPACVVHPGTCEVQLLDASFRRIDAHLHDISTEVSGDDGEDAFAKEEDISVTKLAKVCHSGDNAQRG